MELTGRKKYKNSLKCGLEYSKHEADKFTHHGLVKSS
jgi:hypothetical protein